MAVYNLCLIYKNLGNRAKALEYAQLLPDDSFSNTMTLPLVLEGEELISKCQHNIMWLTNKLSMEIYDYVWRCGAWLNTDEKKRAYQTALKIYGAIYEEEDMVHAALHLSDIYRELAVEAAKLQNKNETLAFLANSVMHAIQYDAKEQGDIPYKSLLFNKWSTGQLHTIKNFMSNISHLLLQHTESKCYDFCRDDENFTNLVEDLRKAAIPGE